MTMGVYKRREISYRERIEIVFVKNNGKRYGGIAKIVGCSKNTAVAICKISTKFRNVKDLPRAGRPKKFKMQRQERSLLRAL